MLELLLIFDYITFSFPNCINSNFENLRRALVVASRKTKKAAGDQKVIEKFIHFTTPRKNLRRLPTSATSQLMVLMQKVNRGSSRSVNTNH